MVRRAGRGGGQMGKEGGLVGAGVSAHPPPSTGAPLQVHAALGQSSLRWDGKAGLSSWSSWGWGTTMHSRA